MFLDIHNWCKWLDFNMGKQPRIVRLYIFLTGARLNKLIPDNGNVHVKIIWKHFP